MCGNGFQHSHSLPFPSIQFSFPPTPIPKSLTYSMLCVYPRFSLSCSSLLIGLHSGVNKDVAFKDKANDHTFKAKDKGETSKDKDKYKD